MNGTDDDRIVRVLRALADAKRFRMVCEVAAAGELSCGQVAEKFHLSQPTVSHHLKLLSDSGVLVIRRAATHGFASVDRGLIEEVADLLRARLVATPRRKRAP